MQVLATTVLSRIEYLVSFSVNRKSMKISIVKCFLFASALLIFGCKATHTTTQSSTTSGNNSKPALSFGEQRKLDVNFSEGVIQKMQGNYPEAIEKFKSCLDIYPNHAASMYEIAFIYN